MKKVYETVAGIAMLILIISVIFLEILGYVWAFTESPTWLSALTTATIQTAVSALFIGYPAYHISKDL